MVHSVVTQIASLFRSARALELRGQRETSFPSPTRKRQGLTSAIPAGTSFSKLRVGRCSSQRAGCIKSVLSRERGANRPAFVEGSTPGEGARLLLQSGGAYLARRMNVTDAIHIERPKTDSKIFAHTRWDVVPALAGLFHLFYFLAMYFLFPYTPLWVMLIMGFVYALLINANINGVAHNFIHNPFFRPNWMNRAFGVIESGACCFSQTYYDAVHMQHHKGNADRPDENGKTVDWISIYQHGHDGEAENPWGYVFLSFFRDNPAAIKRELVKRGNADVRWGTIELATFISVLLAMALIVPTKPIGF